MLGEGFDVIGIDVMSDYYDPQLKINNLASLTSPRFQYEQADLNHVNLDELLKDVQVVFHQAGQPGVRKSWGEDFSIYVDANIRATQALLEAAKRSDSLKKFVYASSSSVYGDAETYPTTEGAVCRPVSPYGVTKLAGEHLCSLYARNFDVPTVSLRYFTVYGPGQRPDMAFTRFLKSAVLGTPINIFGTGEQIRDFTFIDDVVDANVRVALSDTPKGAIYNVAGGSNISVNSVLRLIEEISNKNLDVVYGKAVPGDVFRTGGAIDSIEKAVGWLPRTAISDGLTLHFEWAEKSFGTR